MKHIRTVSATSRNCMEEQYKFAYQTTGHDVTRNAIGRITFEKYQRKIV